MNEKKVIFVRTTEEKHEEIKVEAAKESRSLSNFLMWLFDKYMERKDK